MASSTPSLQQLKNAVKIAEKIEALQQELAAIIGKAGNEVGNGKRKYTKRSVVDAVLEAATPAKKKGKKRTMSPEARAKIVAAQKARWAKVRKDKGE